MMREPNTVPIPAPENKFKNKLRDEINLFQKSHYYFTDKIIRA